MPDKNNKNASVHTSRTMMYAELEKVMNYSIEEDNYFEALNQNITGKLSNSGAVNTAQYLKKLYRFNIEYPPFIALKYFWKIVEPNCRPLLAFIYAVNHDGLLAQSIEVVCKSKYGERVPVENFESNIEYYHPHRFSPKTRKSISQNIASSWKQAGFIEGKVRNIRVHPDINYHVACFAFFLAYLNGDRGDFIWRSKGAKALCLPESTLHDLAAECNTRDLMLYQSAGEVTTISFNQLLKKTGIDAI